MSCCLLRASPSGKETENWRSFNKMIPPHCTRYPFKVRHFGPSSTVTCFSKIRNVKWKLPSNVEAERMCNMLKHFEKIMFLKFRCVFLRTECVELATYIWCKTVFPLKHQVLLRSFEMYRNAYVTVLKQKPKELASSLLFGGARLESRPGHRLYRLRNFMVFWDFPGKCRICFRRQSRLSTLFPFHSSWIIPFDHV